MMNQISAGEGDLEFKEQWELALDSIMADFIYLNTTI